MKYICFCSIRSASPAGAAISMTTAAPAAEAAAGECGERDGAAIVSGSKSRSPCQSDTTNTRGLQWRSCDERRGIGRRVAGQITAGRDRRLVAGPHTCVGPATGQAHTDQEFRIFRADSSLTSETCGMPVSRAVSRLPEKISLRLTWLRENFRHPAINCWTPQASLSARV